MDGVMVISTVEEQLSTISWKRAVTLVVKGLAEVSEAVEGRDIRSSDQIVPFPKSIRLLRTVAIERTEPRVAVCSKKAVLRRDNHQCIYCGRSATTVDHILPRSRGGASTWENLAAACRPCNALKDDRTPEEAGMRIQWTPASPESLLAQL